VRRQYRTGWRRPFGCVRSVISWRETQGQLALVVAVTVAVVSLLGMTVVALSVSQKKAACFYADRVHAYYLAENGIEEILGGVYQDWASMSSVPLSKKVLINRVTPEGSLRVEGYRKEIAGATELNLESRGTYKNASRNIAFKANIYPPIQFEGTIVLEEEPEIHDGAIPLDAYRIGSVPVLSMGWLRHRAETVTEEDTYIAGVPRHGLHFFDGALQIGGGVYPENTVFIASETVTFDSNFRLEGGCAVIVTPENVVIGPGNTVRALIVAGGEVHLKQGASLTGGLIAKKLFVEPHSSVTVDGDCQNRAPQVFTRGTKVIHWKDRSNVY